MNEQSKEVLYSAIHVAFMFVSWLQHTFLMMIIIGEMLNISLTTLT